MNEINIDNLLSKAKNKFLLVNAAASRAKQVADGSLPYIDNFDPTNPVITALREIAGGKIGIKVLTGPESKAKEIILPTLDDEDSRPSALVRLAKGKKAAAPVRKKEKKK